MEFAMDSKSLSLDLVSPGFVANEPKKGLTVLTAIFFIVGEVVGTGILALPYSMAGTGWTGIGVIVGSGLIVSYTGVCLARSWLILAERWPEYRSHVRNPFASIGFRAYGKWMKYLCSAVMQLNFFGGTVVYLLLCAQLVQELTETFLKSITFCDWIIILALLLLPFSMFGSPAEFWPFAFGAIATTFVGLILIIYEIIRESSTRSHDDHSATLTFEKFFLGIGIQVAAFGGLAAFPTFQNDMKDKTQFPKAVLLSLITIVILYLPICIAGYMVFGTGVQDSVVLSMSAGWPKTTVSILLSAHLFLAFLIIQNPVAQEFEAFVNIPKRFTYKRIGTRTILMIACVFTALSIPQFGKLLSLIGGSAISLQIYVLPPILYMKLVRDQHLNDDWPKRNISLKIKIFLYFSIVVGLIAGVSSTYSAVSSIVSPDAFKAPCCISLNSFHN